MSITEKLKNLSLAELAKLRAQAAPPKTRLPAVTAVERNSPADAPVSFSQQRLWLVAQMEGASTAYNIPMALDLRGALDESALRRALDALVARHEALRTVFALVDGEPVQRIEPADRGFALVCEDMCGRSDVDAAIAGAIARDATAPFDLARGPLFRGQLFRRDAEHWVLALNLHHIISDGWSSAVLMRELQELYAAFLHARDPALPALPVQYADYAMWQRRWLSADALDEQAAYWRQQLEGAPTLLELPTDRNRPPVQDYAGGSVPLAFDASLTDRLRALSQRCGTTLYMTVLAAWAVVLSRLSGQHDLIIGTPSANRPRLELENLIGFFVNTLALRIDTSGPASVEALLGHVRKVVLDAQQHQDLPFEQVVEIVRPARSLAHSPLFQVMFAWQGPALPATGLENVDVTAIDEESRFAKYDLTLNLAEIDGGMAGALNYATALFSRDTIERMGGYLRMLLSGMASDHAGSLEALPVLPPDERQKILFDWNDTAASYPADRCIHELFEARARQAPDSEALWFEGHGLTYRELNRQANGLARHLRSHGVGPGVHVAVCIERCVSMVIAVLAVVKAGGAYVPLDPTYPRERLAFLLEDARPAVVLTHATACVALDAAVALLAEPSTLVELDDAYDWAMYGDTDLPPATIGLGSRDLAYLIYTSGSTGKPKGVMIEHHSLVNRLAWMQKAYALDASGTTLHKTPFTFDVSVWELFGTLINGARMVIAKPEAHKDPAYLVDLIRDQRITNVHFVPSMLQVFIEQAAIAECVTLRHVFCSGEALPESLVRRFDDRVPHARLHNLYGPTEATIDVTAWTCPRPFLADQRMMIGRPIDNTRAYILDKSGEPVPIGAMGELCIGGAGVGRGYLNRPELTAEKFVKNPFVPNDHMYRTGDLARFHPTGEIEYIGRSDFQVKLRGFRIELGEIEACMAQAAGVREAIVLAREDAPGDKRLVAYYLTEDNEDISVRAWTELLSAQLPDYMVPAIFIRMEHFPLTANGKLDRKALPVPQTHDVIVRPYEAPASEVERVLARVWAQVLGLEHVGRQDNFFELGGHSLIAVRMIETLKQAGVVTNVLAVFRAPVLAELAEAIERDRGNRVSTLPAPVPEGVDRITPAMVPLASLSEADLEQVASQVIGGPANIQDIYPLTHLQEGILFHHLMEKDGDPYLMWSLVRFRDKRTLDAHVDALEAVILRHDITRSSIAWEGLVEPVQVVWREAPLHVEVLHFDPENGDVAAQLIERINPRRYRMDLRTAPLTRVYAAPDPVTGEWVALRLIHHLIDDVTSAQVLNSEVLSHLQGHGHALPDPLPFKHAVLRAKDAAGAARHEAFFRDMLSRVDEPTAPFSLMNVLGDGSGVSEVHHRLPAGLSACLRVTARQLRVNTAALFHVAWAQVVARAAGRGNPVFGTVLFGRMSLRAEADRILGPFINTLPILVPIDGTSASEGVRETHRRLTELMEHEHASLAMAQRCSGVAAPAPLFTSILNYRHAVAMPHPEGKAGVAEDIEDVRSEERTNYPLVVNIDDRGDDFVINVQAAQPIDPARVCAMLHTAVDALAETLENCPERALATLDVLPPEERQRMLVEWNDTATPYAADLCIHEPFEARAAATPEATAILFEEKALAYGDLNRQANRLARHLRALGVGPGSRVAICVERSPVMAVGLLAILKAGGAYVPLDPTYPPDRLGAMLNDAMPQAVLTQASVRPALQAALDELVDIPPVVDLLAEVDQWAGQDDNNLPPASIGLASSDLAYVIYTSGSTGRPKGIRIAHSPAINLIDWVNRSYQVGPNDCLLFITSISFDLSVYDLFGILAAGGTVWLASPSQLADPQRLVEAMLDERVTFWDSAPAALQMLVPLLEQQERRNPSLRLIFNSGDWIPLSLPTAVTKPFPNARFIALGGATEATIWSNHFEVDKPDPAWRSIPYGRPIQNARYYILDNHLQPVPVGVIGNLYIAGTCLALGYTDAQLTRERFIDSPAEDIPGPLYCTGDLARFYPDGNIEFIGRSDFQVKIRGFRIELGEIEAQLAAFPGIREAVVLAREDTPGNKRLVAYYVTERDAGPLSQDLLSHLQAHLPEYMLPVAFIRMAEMPVTANGKLDRKALPAPDGDAFPNRPFEAPEGDVEIALARIWSEVLGIERVGRHDNFFELGGHSLLAVRVLEKMRKANLQTDIRTLFTTPVLAEIATQTQEYGEIFL